MQSFQGEEHLSFLGPPQALFNLMFTYKAKAVIHFIPALAYSSGVLDMGPKSIL